MKEVYWGKGRYMQGGGRRGKVICKNDWFEIAVVLTAMKLVLPLWDHRENCLRETLDNLCNNAYMLGLFWSLLCLVIQLFCTVSTDYGPFYSVKIKKWPWLVPQLKW